MVAAVVPLIAAVALWLVTGSVLSLWLGLLGPLIAVATRLDAGRAARRERRRSGREWEAACDRVAAALADRHDAERQRRWARTPDVAGFLARDAEIWRFVPGRSGALVVGAGDAPSGVQVGGGADEPRAVGLRRAAATLPMAPVVIPAATGIAVLGDPVRATAVKRALIAQLLLAAPPGELRIVGPLSEEDGWVDRLPHRRSAEGTPLALVAPGQAVPPEAEIAIIRADPTSPLPTGCGAVLTVSSLSRALLDCGGGHRELRVEAISAVQAEQIAAQLVERARSLPGAATGVAGPIVLGELLAAGRESAPRLEPAGLSAVVGVGAEGSVALDLVADGPHAVVAGVTGSGKSELLVTWVLSLCSTYSTNEVSFLLADFKGGTAFDALAALPHVTGVITDLDGAGSRRAIESLRAEVRWREAELSRVGARDVLDSRVALPRLVIVVDEFAALLGDHPELHAVFTDVAARGRALGMHLILGTQRVAGVVRDALLANCPLRVSLRVTDASDSRAVIGSDEAARLPGGAEGAGIAFVRRGSDAVPRRMRVALSAPADVERICAAPSGPRPRRPWLPDLPERVALDDLVPGVGEPGVLTLGLADEPDRQRQVPVAVRIADRGVLVLGRAGSGRSTVLRTLASQAAGVVTVPSDPEAAWDVLARMDEAPPQPGTVIALDDLDALIPRYPHDYGLEVIERVEQLIRCAGDQGIFVAVSMQRLTGAIGRAVELLPRRILLAATSRAEHLAFGGDASHHAVDQPPGRARFDGRAVQVASTSQLPALAVAPTEIRVGAPWMPTASVTGFVARRSAVSRAALEAWEAAGIQIQSVDTAAAEFPRPAGVVIVGEPDDWQRHWQLLATVRGECDLVIDAACAAEFRSLAADRALPPFCVPGRPRAWLCTGGESPRRVVLPASGGSRDGEGRGATLDQPHRRS